MIEISSWGRLSFEPHQAVELADPRTAIAAISSAPLPGIAYGMGRSYGDVCLNPKGSLWKTSAMDRFVSFDEQSGLLTCCSGVILRDIQRLFLPRGWSLPVTPGTQLITVGGAIANDVHGKNHHRLGSFGDHIASLKILRSDGEMITCSPDERPDWLAATIGGIGLTGVILEAVVRMRRVGGAWMDTETIAYEDMGEFFRLSDSSESGWEHTVAWIDSLSGKKARGIFMRGNVAENQDRARKDRPEISFPFAPPFSLVNGMTLRPFNSAYFHLGKLKAGRRIAHCEDFLYPLDHILNWNRMYGPKGFFQYQSVVPRAAGYDAVRSMLDEIARSGEGSFLAVIKTFGERQSLGMLSFPQSGVTLALDFPNRGEKTLKLFERLDAIVREAKGRLYLAKDARMSREMFLSGYPRFAEFAKYRDKGISSAMSRRLMEQ